jgi:hypothetical protein
MGWRETFPLLVSRFGEYTKQLMDHIEGRLPYNDPEHHSLCVWVKEAGRRGIITRDQLEYLKEQLCE